MNSFSWGVQGYDPELIQYGSKRFTVNQHYGNNDLLDIYVDSKEVQFGVEKIELISKNALMISSNECWKAIRHITAPIACSFKKSVFKRLSEKGKIRVFNKTQNIIHEDEIDFTELNNFLNGLNVDPNKS